MDKITQALNLKRLQKEAIERGSKLARESVEAEKRAKENALSKLGVK